MVHITYIQEMNAVFRVVLDYRSRLSQESCFMKSTLANCESLVIENNSVLCMEIIDSY